MRDTRAGFRASMSLVVPQDPCCLACIEGPRIETHVFTGYFSLDICLSLVQIMQRDPVLVMAQRFHLGRQVGLAAGALIGGWLSAVTGTGHAWADQVVRSPDVAVTPETADAAVPRSADAKIPTRIPALLARVEQQIMDGRMWSPPNDNVVDTFRSIVSLLPHASMSDLQTIRGIPSRFEARAREAEAAGRHEEAQRFLVWAQAFATSPAVVTSQADQAAHDAPGADATTPPSREVPPGAEVTPPPTVTPPEAAGHGGPALEGGKIGAAETDGQGLALSSPEPPTAAAPSEPSGLLGTTGATATADEGAGGGVDASRGSASATQATPESVGSERSAAVPPTAPVAGVMPETRDQPASTAPTPPPGSLDSTGLQAAARPVGPPPPSGLVALLLRRGAEMQRLGDISAARLLYGRAAMAGSAQAATAMGEMFDPIFLAEIGVHGVVPDPDTAAGWYRKAIALGDRDAESRLEGLGRQPGAKVTDLPSPANPAPAIQAPRAPTSLTERHVARVAADR